MKKMPARRAGLVVLLALCLPAVTRIAVAAARASDEVGIDEKLGRMVPLDIQLVDETGGKVALGDLIDAPVILTLNYFRCAAICTPQLNNLAGALNRLDLEPARDFKVLTVSFDDRDTPQIAAAKRVSYLNLMQRPFAPAGWRFLTGEAASTRALADAVGFGFRRQGEDFIHPAALVILSPQGKITRYMYGITYPPFDLKMALIEASKGQAQPTVARFLQFCYTYDSQGRRYAFNMTRVIGAAIVVMAGIFFAVLVIRRRRVNP